MTAAGRKADHLLAGNRSWCWKRIGPVKRGGGRENRPDSGRWMTKRGGGPFPTLKCLCSTKPSYKA